MDKSPDAFRTISEVAEQLDTPAHVLRFWESRFPQVRPVKRAGGRRYYRPGDVALLAGIKRLLHDDGLTIRGVQKLLREQGVRHVASLGSVPGAPLTDLDVEAVLAAEFGPATSEPEPVAEEAQTAQVISLQEALARQDARSPAPAPEVELPPEDVPEAPFIEAEEEDLPAPLPLHAQDDAPDTPAEADAETPDESEQGVETLAESTLAMRLRRADPQAMVAARAELLALQARILDLRARLAKGVRRRAR